jgi:hypothetical protein
VRRAPAVAVSVAAVVVAVGLGGCGGGSSKELSDRQLELQATRGCTVANRRTERIHTPTAPAGGEAFLTKGIAVLAPEYRQLQALRPPSDLAQVYTISLNAFGGKLAAIRAAVHNLDRGEDPVIAMKTLQQQLAPLESSEDGAWQALQVPACVTR